MTAPLNFHIWIVEGQGQSADSGRGLGKAIDLSEGQGHIPYMKEHVLLKVKIGHLTIPSSFFLLFHFDLELGGVTPNLCWIVWQIYFYKINSKSI